MPDAESPQESNQEPSQESLKGSGKEPSKSPHKEPSKDRIIAESLREFARVGFTQASTNAIAQRAGVGKGLLFHYFSNKEGLFWAVYDNVEARSLAAYQSAKVDLPKSLFARLKANIHVKLAYTKSHPLDALFLMRALADAPLSIREKLWVRSHDLTASLLDDFVADLDTKNLHGHIQPKKVIEMLGLISESLLDKSLRAWLDQHPQETSDNSESTQSLIDMIDRVIHMLDPMLEMLRFGVEKTPEPPEEAP